MCFSGEMSAAFAACGLFATYWIYTRTENMELASGVFFFFSMEFLQAIQYMFLASGLDDPMCKSVINQVLTLMGFLHICLQPYYCHVINSSLTKSCKYKDRYLVIKRLCLIGGMLLFSRHFLSYIPGLNTMGINGSNQSTEWLRGESLCTFKKQSMWHLGWSIPMADPSYYVMGAGIHSFLMFAPFFALYEKKGMIIQGCFLFLFGPVLASAISDNLMEQASIWCFFSIAQICTMLFLIRETLIINWGKGNISALKADKNTSAAKASTKTAECRDFINCSNCESGSFAKGGKKDPVKAAKSTSRGRSSSRGRAKKSK